MTSLAGRAILATLFLTGAALAEPAPPLYPTISAGAAGADEPWSATELPVSPSWETPPPDAPFALPPARRAGGKRQDALDLMELIDPETAKQSPLGLRLGTGGLTFGLGTEF